MKKIETLDELFYAAQDKRSVVSRGMGPCQSPKPAAFVISMQGTCIRRLMAQGLYLYEAGTSEKPWPEFELSKPAVDNQKQG